MFSRTTSCASCRKVFNKSYRAANKEYFRNYQLEHREQLLIYRRKWIKENKLKVQVYAANNAIKRQKSLDNCLPDEPEYIAVIEANPCCVITGSTVDVELDHILPVTAGNWGNTRGNLMWLYKPLNTSKNSTNVFTWIEQMDQKRLNYLLPESFEITVIEFRKKILHLLNEKAAEKGQSFEQYKEEYESSFKCS